MHAVYLLLNLRFNSNVKFKFKLYSNYIKILIFCINLIYNCILLFNIYLFISMYIINWNHES